MTVINFTHLLYRNLPLLLPIFLNGALILAGARQAKTANEKRSAENKTHLNCEQPPDQKQSKGEVNAETLLMLPVILPPVIAGAVNALTGIGAAAVAGALANKLPEDKTGTLLQTSEFADKKADQLVEGKVTANEAFDSMYAANVPEAHIVDAINATPGLNENMYQIGEQKGAQSFLRNNGLTPDAKPKTKIFPTVECQDRSILAKEAQLEASDYLSPTDPAVRRQGIEQINPEMGEVSGTYSLANKNPGEADLTLPYDAGSNSTVQKAHARITGQKRKLGRRGGGGDQVEEEYKEEEVSEAAETRTPEFEAGSQYQLVSPTEYESPPPAVSQYYQLVSPTEYASPPLVERGSVGYLLIAFGGFFVVKAFFDLLVSQVTQVTSQTKSKNAIEVTSKPKRKNKPISKEQFCVLELYKAEVLTYEAASKLLRVCARQALKKSSGNSNSNSSESEV